MKNVEKYGIRGWVEWEGDELICQFSAWKLSWNPAMLNSLGGYTEMYVNSLWVLSVVYVCTKKPPPVKVVTGNKGHILLVG